ncbi:MAG: alpha/beta hydrolase [Candidatus Margulisiibacteriota bacterium]
MHILLITLSIIATIIIAGYAHYFFWRRRLINKLNSQSTLIETSMGTVEYIWLGPKTAPVILISHGGGTGYDNAYLYAFLLATGCSILCPSKPGYLRTPLSVGKTFEEHADMFAALLDALSLKSKVAMLGVSLGGPAALLFALRHQDRTKCLIIQDAVSQEYHPSQEAEKSLLGKLYLSSSGRKFLSWAMTVSTYLWPKATFLAYLQVETLYDNKHLKKMADEIMKDSTEVEKFKQFSEKVAPLDLRAPGMDNEMIYATKIPRYPLETIHLPTLVTQSRMDRDVAKSHGEFVANTIPGAEAYYFDGCGHMFWFGKEWPGIKDKMIAFLKINLILK